jgi:hypothetical protein
MDSGEYRQHAAGCRSAAERATEPIRGDFLAAASIWDMLADQWEWLKQAPEDRKEPSAPAALSRDRSRNGVPHPFRVGL